MRRIRRWHLLVLGSLFLLFASGYGGYQIGRINQKANDLAVYQLALPVGIATKFAHGKTSDGIAAIEETVDRAIIQAIFLRNNVFLFPSNVDSLNGTLSKAFAHRLIRDYTFDLGKINPTVREELLEAQEALAPPEYPGNVQND